MKTFFAMLMLFGAQCCFAGGEAGGGGAACIDQNGQPTTLYYCGAYTNPQLPAPVTPHAPVSIDAPSENPPEISALEKTIANLPYLEPEVRDKLLNTIAPSFTRRYFTTQAPPDLTAPIVARIKEEFQRVTNINASKLSLYAVTDTNAHISHYDQAVTITYLLPLYSALPTLEQKMVALFHENLWALAPNADYQTIIKNELAFEAVLAEPNDTNRMLEFANEIELLAGGQVQNSRMLALMLKSDIETGALSGFLNSNNEFTTLQLFGLANINCYAKTIVKGIVASSDECGVGYMDYLDGLRRANPNSRFLERVANDAQAILSDTHNGGSVFMALLCSLYGACGDNGDANANWSNFDIGYNVTYRVWLPAREIYAGYNSPAQERDIEDSSDLDSINYLKISYSWLPPIYKIIGVVHDAPASLFKIIDSVSVHVNKLGVGYFDAFPKTSPVSIKINLDSPNFLKGDLLTLASLPEPSQKPKPKKH